MITVREPARARSVCATMMLPRNTPCRKRATPKFLDTKSVRAVLGPLVLALALFSGTRGAYADLPEAGASITTFLEVERLIRSWDVAPDVTITEPDGVEGACITLRLAGRVIGRGSVMSNEGDAVTRAFQEAWREANERVEVDRDALQQQRIAARAGRVIVDLQLAGTPQPVLGDTFAAAAQRAAPGIHGVAIGIGPRLEGVFPGTQLATGALPDQAMRIAAAKLDLPPLELNDIRTRYQAIPYVFPVRHLAQIEPQQQPIFLYRSGAVVPLAETNGPSLRAAARAIAAHLQAARWTGPQPFGLRGDQNLATGRYETPIAPPRAQALAAFALARYAGTPGFTDEERAEARIVAAELLRLMTIVEEDEVDPFTDPAACAAWLIASTELAPIAEPGQALEQSAFAEAAQRRLVETVTDAESRDALPPGARAMIALALVRRASTNDALREHAAALMRDLRIRTPAPQMPTLMPWLGWAELALAQDADDLPSEIALRDMRDLVWQYQIGDPDPAARGHDLAGGIVFTNAPDALPTWHCLRPIAFVASMLGDSRLTTGDELAAELGRLRLSLRYVVQLSVREAESHMMAHPRRSIGGVRRAVWDQTASIDACSLALLTLCETLRAVDSRAGG
jgi:hypothetical protein